MSSSQKGNSLTDFDEFDGLDGTKIVWPETASSRGVGGGAPRRTIFFLFRSSQRRQSRNKPHATMLSGLTVVSEIDGLPAKDWETFSGSVTR